MTLDPLTGTELHRIIRQELRNCALRIGDRTYAAVKKSFMIEDVLDRKDFYSYYKKVLEALQIPDWREDFDCDDFAMLFKIVSSALHRHAKKVHKDKPESPAVGLMWYTTRKGTGHAINVCIGEGYKIFFLEPQTGEELCLTDQEKRSCYFVLF